MQNEWRGFQRGSWEEEINVRDFIQKNYTPYDGDDSFLEGPTQDTTDLWNEVLELSKQEREAGLSPRSHPTDRAIWTRARRRLSAFRQISRSSVPCSRTAESAWQ